MGEKRLSIFLDLRIMLAGSGRCLITHPSCQ
jgi:hypothetical protein